MSARGWMERLEQRAARVRRVAEQTAAAAAARETEETVVELEQRRPTVTRVAGGMLLGGIPGALLGFAWRKKERQRIRIR